MFALIIVTHPREDAQCAQENVQVPADHLEGSCHQHLVAPLAVQGDSPVVDHLTVTTTTESVPPSLPAVPQVHSHAPTCWPRLLRCPVCSVCSTWMRTYSWSVMSTTPPANGPPTCNFSRALSLKSVRFMAVWQLASRKQLQKVLLERGIDLINRLKPDLILWALRSEGCVIVMLL